MTETNVTRRGFMALAGASAAAAGCLGLSGCAASGEAIDKSAGAAEQVASVCSGCVNACGLTAWTRGGKLWRASGAVGHKTAAGSLCGRGQGAFGLPESKERLAHPMVRKNGKLVEATWDEAIAAAAAGLSGAGSKAAVFQGSVSACVDGSFFAKRFASALGTANYYTEAAVRGGGLSAAQDCVFGARPVADVENASYALLLGRDVDDAASPAQYAAFAEKHLAGEGRRVLVGSRLTSLGRVVDEWIAIRPGTELALLLAVACEMVRAGTYDRAFLREHAQGFEDFAQSISAYSALWASEICGVSVDAICSIATGLGTNAPHACVDIPQGSSFGSAGEGSFDACRMAMLVNAMIGNFNQEGGLWFSAVSEPDAAALARAGIPEFAVPSASAFGCASAQFGDASCMAAIPGMESGAVKAGLAVSANPVHDWPSTARVRAAFEGLDCLVVADAFLTETAEIADVVLPLTVGLESNGEACLRPSEQPYASMRVAAVDPVGDAKSLSETVTLLADACDLSYAFGFDLETYNRAWCKAMGLSYESLLMRGTTTVSGWAVSAGSIPVLATPSGKVVFSSSAVMPAGVKPIPTWVEPTGEASEGMPRLLIGQQNIQQASALLASEKLIDAAKRYDLDRVWINTSVARAKGISDGDAVKLTTSLGSVTLPAKVTGRIHPSAVWVPAHYGADASSRKAAAGFGANAWQLVPFATAPADGGAKLAEVLVNIEKAGA